MVALKVFTILLLFSISELTYSQNPDDKSDFLKSNKLLYTSFQKFYTDSIRQDGLDEWGEPYFKKIDQINGVHYFDYNNNGLEDALVEFSVRNSDGGTWYMLVAVLFENVDKQYIYKAHFKPENLLFKKYQQPFFILSGRVNRFQDETTTKKYKLLNNKFVEY
ncbi:hypothetical protein MHL31_12520 [Lutibacter sp. A80]|uniref:hypothetical protein n=1 Tax=Lutibacter sp. A80 TaxID=2918453 RepID=UPI001F06960C|nr:hypothetical protein [Lutibacter sp. A80]UMB59894.1 hypothetical protein MHL31_12520 [Lutibacter sp. A80]